MNLPWKGTGCKLNYQTLEDQEWMAPIDFDSLMDDGLIFMWVANAKFEAAVEFMKGRGWKRIEIIRWNKVQSDG